MTNEVKRPRKVQYGARMIATHARVGEFRLEFFESTLPPSLNTTMRMHWTTRKRLSDLWNRIVSIHVGSSKPRRPLARARLTLTRRGMRELDFDNLCASFKVVVDALRHNGILKDDKHENIGMPKFLFEKVKRKDVGIVVLVEGGKEE